MARRSGLGQRAARHQATHAVAQHHDVVQRHRPIGDQLLQRIGQRQAVVGDVAPAVVVGVDGRQAQRAAQQITVVVAVAVPAEVAHAEAVHQQQHAARRLGSQ